MTATNIAIVAFSSYLTVSSITGPGAKLNTNTDPIMLNAYTKATKDAILKHWQKRVKDRILERLWKREVLEASEPRIPLLVPIPRTDSPSQPADHQDTTCDNEFGAPYSASFCKHFRSLNYSKANLDLDSAKSGPHIHALATALSQSGSNESSWLLGNCQGALWNRSWSGASNLL